MAVGDPCRGARCAVCWFRKVRDSAGMWVHRPEGQGEAPASCLQPEETTSLQALRFPFFHFCCFFVSFSRGRKVLMGSRCLKSKYTQGRGRWMVRAGQTGTLTHAGSSRLVHGNKHKHPPTVWPHVGCSVPVLTRDGVRSRWAPQIKSEGKQWVVPGWATVYITIQPHERCHKPFA